MRHNEVFETLAEAERLGKQDGTLFFSDNRKRWSAISPGEFPGLFRWCQLVYDVAYNKAANIAAEGLRSAIGKSDGPD